MKTKVSIILPSLNVEKYIRECLESVINQTLKEIEIVCVDAGSVDGTLQIIKEYATKDSRIKIIESNIKSYGHQMNIGIREAKGVYIGIVETDDFVDKEMFKELYERANEIDADVVKTPFIEYINNKISNICYYAETLEKILPTGCFSAVEYGHILAYHASVWSGIYKKQYLLDKQISFVEAPGAGYVDVGFRFDTCVNTEKIAWINKPFYFYRTNNSNSSTNNFNLSVMIQRWKEIQSKSLSIKKLYDEYYSPYLILDEYLNTLKYMSSIKVSKEEAKDIYYLFLEIKKEKIIESPVLPDYIKDKILSFIDNPELYYRKAQICAYIKKPFIIISNLCFAKGTKRREIIKKYLLLTK